MTNFFLGIKNIIMKKITYILFLFLFTTTLYSQPITDGTSCEGIQTIGKGNTTVVPPPDFPSITGDSFDPVTPPSNPPANLEDRIVFWIHGLDGNISSWEKVAAATQDFVDLPDGIYYPPREILSKALELENFENALESTASQAKTELTITTAAFDQDAEARENNIIIAHSQGGLVSRFIDKLEHLDGYRNFGGLVTFGTAHRGAQIINNVDILQGFLSESCEELGLPLVTEEAIAVGNTVADFINSKPILDFFINEGDIQDKILEVSQVSVGAFCNVIDDIAALTVLAGNTTPLSEEYAVGSPILEGENGINSFQTPIPKVAFYGIEPKEEVLWTTLYYLTNNPNTADYFSAINDFRGVETAQENTLLYQSKRDAYQQMIDLFSIQLDLPGGQSVPFIPPHPLNSNFYCDIINDNFSDIFTDPDELVIAEEVCTNNTFHIQALIDAWNTGLNWWLTANERYKIAIGAVEISTSLPHCHCEVFDVNNVLLFSFNGNIDPSTGTCSEITYPNHTVNCEQILADVHRTEKESDGVVLAESASGLPQTNGLENERIVEMEGSSHIQMRNDENLRLALLSLWEGGIDFFFYTETK